MSRTMSPFVAREVEVAQLVAAIGRAAQGDPSLVLVGADAGVGKSRLLSHVADLASADSVVVTTYCVDLGEVGLPYLPFAEALLQLYALDGARDAVAEAARSRPALSRLLPGVGTPGPHIEDEASRLQLFDGIAAALAAVAGPGRPLVLVVEDLHWSDPSSRDVLRYLVARMRHEHVLIVGSYRTDDLHRTHPLRPFLAEIWRHPRVERLDLAPFTPAELRLFATAIHGSPLAESDLFNVLERSEGNAYFAEQLIEAGTGPSALPWSLGEVLRSRLERLDPSVQQLARIASVAGRRVSEPLLRAVAEQHCSGEVDVDSLLRDAVAAHLLGWEDGGIAFRHALLAEAVYTDLLPGEQVTLHRAFRDAIAADPTLASSARLAHHAQASHDLPTALRASMAAADEAGRVLAPAEELRHLETALGLWDSVPDAAELAGMDRVAVLDRASSAASRTGDAERAVSLARDAVASAEAGRRPRLRRSLARHLLAAEREDEALAEATQTLADLPDTASASDRAWALSTHARACLVRDRDDDARASATAAVREADTAGDNAAAADALATLAVLVVDDPDKAAELLRDARTRAREAGDLVTEQRCTHNLVTTYYYAGRLEEAAQALAAALERARECGLEWSEFGIAHRFFDVLVRYCRGDLAPPERIVESAPSAIVGSVPYVALFDGVALYSAVARGDEDAITRGQALRAVWDRDSQVALLSGGPTIDALTWAGELDAALELATELIDHLNRSWDDYFLGGIWLAALALAALADGAQTDRLMGVDPALKTRNGAELLARAVRTAERGRPRGGRLGPEGVAWLARARAEHSRMVGPSDPGLWRAATEAFGYGYRYEEARSRWRWAEALLGVGERDAARDQLARARTEAREMGARPLAAALDALARRGRLDAPGASRGGDGLTDREAEVLELVAKGLTNRQIGERLFISGKTVSVHVSNLLAKLGVTGRAEAVAVAHRRGLLAG